MKIRITALGIAGMMTLSAMGQYRVVRGAVLPPGAPQWTVIRDNMEVVKVEAGNIACITFTEHDEVSGAGGNGNGQLWPVHHLVKTYLESFIITNYPSASRFKHGDVIRGPIRLMRVGDVRLTPVDRIDRSDSGERRSSYGINSTLYDYGTDYVPPPRVLTAKEAEAAQEKVGQTVSEQAAATFKFHKDRAVAGNAGSQFRLGELYLAGKGCNMDTNQARLWFRKAAAQGNEDAVAALRAMDQ